MWADRKTAHEPGSIERATEEVNQMAEKKISPKAPEGARTADEPAARVTKKQTMKKLSHKKLSHKKLSH